MASPTMEYIRGKMLSKSNMKKCFLCGQTGGLVEKGLSAILEVQGADRQRNRSGRTGLSLHLLRGECVFPDYFSLQHQLCKCFVEDADSTTTRMEKYLLNSHASCIALGDYLNTT